MKATSTFKMDKEIKRQLSTLDQDRRSLFKNLMINAQLSFEQAKRQSLKSKNSNDSGE